MLSDNRHFNNHLQNSWNKHGSETWNFKVHTSINTGCDSLDLEIASEIEQSHLDLYLEKGLLYNISSSSKTGMVTGKNHHFYGKHPSEWMGKKFNEHIKTLTGRRGLDNPFYGLSHSEETREILRKKCANFGEKNGFYGKKHTPETIEKLKKAGDKRSIPVVIKGVEYRSIRDAARKSGFTRSQIYHRLKRDEFKEFQYKNKNE